MQLHVTTYDRTELQSNPKHDIAFPALFHVRSDAWILLTEAAVYGDYCGSRLAGSAQEAGRFQVRMDGPVEGRLPLSSPWRVAMVGHDLGTIVESILVPALNPPCAIQDTSWIRPGRVTFPWWSEPKVKGNFERLKQFVDFGGEMGWEWMEFDTALIGSENKASDTWMHTAWVPELVKYAAAKNVRLYGWEDWTNLDTPEKREKILRLYNQWGLQGSRSIT